MKSNTPKEIHIVGCSILNLMSVKKALKTILLAFSVKRTGKRASQKDYEV